MKQKFKDLKVNDRVKTLHSGMATVVKVYNEGTMVKLDCDVKKWNCPYFYEHELDFGDQDIDEQDVHQETLEEAAKNYNLNTINAFGDYESFIAGAKWQQERSYSEEDMMDYSNYRLLIKKALSPKEWFEQFKNK